MNTFGSLTVIPDNKKGRGRILLSSGSAEDAMLLNKVRDAFTSPNPAYRFCPGSDPTCCPITAQGSFKIAFASTIEAKIKEFNGSIQIEESVRQICQPGPVGFIPPISNEKFTYRDYQEEAINNALTFGRGVVLLPTSAGKSLVCHGICFGILPQLKKDECILILVPTTNLVEQFYKDLLDYGAPIDLVTKFSGQNRVLPHAGQIVISNRQYLQAKGNFKKLPPIGAVMADECHTSVIPGGWGAKFFESLTTLYKFGMTATLPDQVDKKWGIIGIIGPILVTKNVCDLQRQGHIAELDIITVKINHVGFKEPKYTEYDDFCKAYVNECARIEASEHSNKVISSLADALASSGLNVILLFDHTIHGQKLYSLIKCPRKWFIDGSVNVDIREDARTETETAYGSVIVSQTKVFGTGTNIKKLHALVLACPGKCSTKVLQTIGRTLRPHSSKNKALVYDISHGMKYSLRHYSERVSMYKRYYDINPRPPKIINVEFRKETSVDIE